MKKLWFLSVLLGTLSISQAAITDFSASLTGGSVVPPVVSPGSGIANASFDSTSLSLSVSGSFSSLAAGSTFVALYQGAAGTTGTQIFSLSTIPGGSTSGSFSGNGLLSSGQASSLLAGNVYVQVNSGAFPSGELRGQLTVVPEPQAYVMVAGLALAAFGAWRRFSRKP